MGRVRRERRLHFRESWGPEQSDDIEFGLERIHLYCFIYCCSLLVLLLFFLLLSSRLITLMTGLSLYDCLALGLEVSDSDYRAIWAGGTLFYLVSYFVGLC